MLTGHVETTFVDETTFNALHNAAASAVPPEHAGLGRRARKRALLAATAPRRDRGTPEDVAQFQGPWAGFAGEVAPLVADEDDTLVNGVAVVTDAADAAAAEAATAASSAVGTRSRATGRLGAGGAPESTRFHGVSERDYQGRTYLSVDAELPAVLSQADHVPETRLPQRMVHCWTGHTKAVTAMEWFPGTAHLLLTSSMDSQIKLWDVYRRRGCLRTFVGHTRGVKDISFRSDGLFFLSAGHDRWIKQWDTVTGQCTARWQTKRITNMVRYHPNNPHQFFAACDDGAVHQMDVRTGQTVQSYDQHQAAVNTITFIDEGRRFVTTSSDKAVRLWEMDIPVVIKYVADPAMHSIPAMATRPGGSALIGQSLDNQIVVFQAGKDRFRMNRKKAFKGHLVAGYACVPGFAPDGRYVVSGDSEGQIWFWDWAQGRHLKTLRAHDGVVSKVLWHPHEASHLASCSWDGTIKYWA